MMRDRKVAGFHDPSEALAQRLLSIAGDQNVRVIEEDEVADAQAGNGSATIGLQEQAAPFLGDDVQRLQLCRRIARRALRGSLADPTRGATAFHRIETTPDWSRRLLPVAVFGSFLFYRR
jgi:hypothetical protein